MSKRLRVAINAQLMPAGAEGGTITVLKALTSLAWLEDGDEEYVFVAPAGDPEWLRPFLPAGQEIRAGLKTEYIPSPLESFKRALGPLRSIARDFKSTLRKSNNEREGSFFTSLNCDVVHFPYQAFELCDLPTVYNPHDLQHLHHPEFFSQTELEHRDKLHPFACQAADAVVVASRSVKRDVVESFDIDPEKVYVVTWGPPPVVEPAGVSFEDIRKTYGLPAGEFALYPAMTWPHKNHLRLVEAVAWLRDRHNLSVSVVCTGHKTDFWPVIENRIRKLELTERIVFPGMAPQADLDLIYRNAQFVILPTMFEAASAPLFEAWQRGVPVAISSIESLTDQAAGSARVFDHFSVESIATTLLEMATDAEIRRDLITRGHKRLADFSSVRTAKTYRAIYRKVAGRTLSPEDQLLLQGNP